MSRPEGQAAPPGWAAAGFFLLRTPTLPFESLLRWSEPGPAEGAVPDTPPSPEELRERLRAALDPVFQEAVYLASPSLFDGLAHWLADPHGRKGQAVEHRLVTFFARMAGRATPFGTFAGVTAGTVGSGTALRLRPLREYRRRTRFQTQFLLSLTTALQNAPEVRGAVRYRPNPTLFSCAGELRYIETLQNPALAAIRHYHAVRCERAPYLDHLLVWAEQGATRDELAAKLAEAENATLDESAAFLEELIEAQVLTPDLDPPLTDANAAASLATDLCRLGAAGPAALLRQAEGALADLDRRGLGTEVPEYRRLCHDFARLPFTFEETELFQVDLVKPAERAELSSAVAAEILRGVEVLWRLSPRIVSPWERFRAAFVARFGEREVPLLQALDSEVGLELFPSRAIDPELVETVPGSRPPGREVAWTVREEHLAGRLARAMARGAKEIALDDQDLRLMAADEPEPLPDCFTVLATILAPSAAAIDRGDYRYRVDGFGLSADLLARFCGLDQDLQRHVEDLLRREELSCPDAVLADVVHYPAVKADGNVVARPYLGSYEIPYLGRSGAPVEKQLAVSDLVVAVREGRVVLRSRRLGREVLPRLGTAHKFQNPAYLPVYQFLAGLRQQPISRLPLWDWGPVFLSFPFLPRIVCGRLLVAAARWRLDGDDLAAMKRRQPNACGEIVERWRGERGVPRFVVLRSFDRRLPVDLSNPLMVAALAHHVRRLDGAWLEELCPGPEDLCVEAPEGRYSHEILLPYLKDAAATSTRGGVDRETPAGGTGPTAELFPPGSDWLYLKLYGSGALLERLLVRALGPWLRTLRQRQRIARWFFVRYSEPRPHLRLRLRCRPGELAPVLAELRALADEGMADASLDRVEIDTYERESERYGGREAIDLAEQVFEADSEAALDLMEAHGGRVPWWLCLAGADSLLADFGLSLSERWRLARALRDAYRREFAHDREFPHRAGARFRRVRSQLPALMGEERKPAPLETRSRALAPVVLEFQTLAAGGRLSRPLHEIVASFVHMHLDRMLRGELRTQEALLYDWLFRLYDARSAQARPGAGTSEVERADT